MLIGKSIPFQLLDLHVNPSGKFIIIHASPLGKPYVLAGVYIPPPFQRKTLDDIMAKVSLHPNTLFILLGDFNTTLRHMLDKLHHPQMHNKTLYSWAQAHNLTEICNWLKPNSKQFSCFSATTNSLVTYRFSFCKYRDAISGVFCRLSP